MGYQLKYHWFSSLPFDFNKIYRGAGGLKNLDRIFVAASKASKGQPNDVGGTTFKQRSISAHRRLFALARNDPEARAELASLIVYADGKNRVAGF